MRAAFSDQAQCGARYEVPRLFESFCESQSNKALNCNCIAANTDAPLCIPAILTYTTSPWLCCCASPLNSWQRNLRLELHAF